MKKSFIFYGIFALTVLFILSLGFVWAFFFDIPIIVDNILKYTPAYIVGFVIFFSLLYSRDLHFGRMEQGLPLTLLIVCTVVFTIWGITTYLGHISFTRDLERQFEDVFAKDVVVESEYTNEYLYSWEEESTDTAYIAHMPFDENLDGIILETEPHEIVISGVYEKNYFDFFPMRFLRYYRSNNNSQVPLWLMLLVLVFVGLAYCMPIMVSGLFAKRFFQFLFGLNVLGLYSILLNVFINYIIVILIISIVIVLGLFLCVILRINNALEHFDVGDVDPDFNPFTSEEGEEQKIDNTQKTEYVVPEEAYRKKMLAYWFCVFNTLAWLVIVWFAFPVERFGIFFLQYAVIPVIIILLILSVYSKQRVISKHFMIISLGTYLPLLLLYSIFVIFLSSDIFSFFQKINNRNYFKNKIISSYEKAVVLRNKSEMFELAKYFKKEFPNDTRKFPEVANFVEGQDFSIQKVSADVEKTTSEGLTPLNFSNLSKLELLQHANDYVEDGHFYAAYVLIVYYKNLYGIDTQRIIQLEDIISDHIRLELPSYSQQARIQLQRQIQYLYTILAKQEINEDTLAAYYQAQALLNGIPNNVQLQWLVDSYQNILAQGVFYASDARIALLKEQGKYPISFVEKKDFSKILWFAKDVSYYNGDAFFKNLELLAIDQRIGRIGEILWHIKTPYAKLSNNQLMLYSLEPGNLYTKHIPKYIVNNTKISISWNMNTSIDAKDVVTLQAREDYLSSVQDINYLFYFFNWEKYSLPISHLYAHILEDLFKIVLFMGTILFLVYMRMLFFNDQSYSVPYLISMHGLYAGFLIFLPAYYHHFILVISFIFHHGLLIQVIFWFFISLFLLVLAIVIAVLHVLFIEHRERYKEHQKALYKQRLEYEKALKADERKRRREEFS